MEQRYVEEAAFEELQRKIEKICRENSLMCKFVNGDPIRLVIWPDMSMEGQLSMLDEPAGHTGHGSVLTILFADADVTYKVSGGFVVSQQLLGRLLSNARKLHYHVPVGLLPPDRTRPPAGSGRPRRRAAGRTGSRCLKKSEGMF